MPKEKYSFIHNRWNQFNDTFVPFDYKYIYSYLIDNIFNIIFPNCEFVMTSDIYDNERIIGLEFSHKEMIVELDVMFKKNTEKGGKLIVAFMGDYSGHSEEFVLKFDMWDFTDVYSIKINDELLNEYKEEIEEFLNDMILEKIL